MLHVFPAHRVGSRSYGSSEDSTVYGPSIETTVYGHNVEHTVLSPNIALCMAPAYKAMVPA